MRCFVQLSQPSFLVNRQRKLIFLSSSASSLLLTGKRRLSRTAPSERTFANAHSRTWWRGAATTADREDKSSCELSNLPGVIASIAVMGSGFYLAEHLGDSLLMLQGISGSNSPVSGIPVSILLGMVARTCFSAQMLNALDPGLKYATTYILRGGIICVGIKLSCLEMASLGVTGLPVVTLSVASGLGYAMLMGPRLGLSARQSSLIAAGTSICGVTAITACAPAIKATKHETSIAVANVVLFGTLGMLVYPLVYFAHSCLDSSQQVGTFLGLAIHDTSQVMGAALTYNEVFQDELALQTAAVTKLTRNLFLAGVVPGMVWANVRSNDNVRTERSSETNSAQSKQATLFERLSTFVPTFVMGFVAMAGVRSVGDSMLANDMLAYGVLESDQWKQATNILGSEVGGRYMLGSAMAAVGLSTSIASFKGSNSLRPLFLGSSTALVVGTTAYASVSLLGQIGAM